MPLTQVSKPLWTPTGEVSTREKDVLPLTRDEIITLSKMHEIAHKFQMNIFCKRCEKPFSGQNNDSSPFLSVSCQCRELRFTR